MYEVKKCQSYAKKYRKYKAQKMGVLQWTRYLRLENELPSVGGSREYSIY